MRAMPNPQKKEFEWRMDRSRCSARSYASSQGRRRLTRKIGQGDLDRVDGGISSGPRKEGPPAEGKITCAPCSPSRAGTGSVNERWKGYVVRVWSYGLLLAVVLIVLYFTKRR